MRQRLLNSEQNRITLATSARVGISGGQF